MKGLHADTSVAEALKLSKSNFSAYKQKGRIPYRALLRYAGEQEIALDYLLEGVLAAGTGAINLRLVSESSVYDSRWPVDKLIDEAKKILAGENRAAAESLEAVIKFHCQSRDNEKRLVQLETKKLEILKAKKKALGKNNF